MAGMTLAMCACARTREYCVTRGCKRDTFEWRFSTEGRDKDHLRRVIDLRRKGRPASHWLRPERAVTLAWALNMEAPAGVLFVEKINLDGHRFEMDGVA